MTVPPDMAMAGGPTEEQRARPITKAEIKFYGGILLIAVTWGVSWSVSHTINSAGIEANAKDIVQHTEQLEAADRARERDHDTLITVQSDVSHLREDMAEHKIILRDIRDKLGGAP